MIHPSNQQLFRGQLHQLLYVLPLLQEVDEPRHCGDGDLLEQVHLDELPQQAQYQPFLTLHIILSYHTVQIILIFYLTRVKSVTVTPNNHTPYSLGRGYTQGQVLMLLHRIYYSNVTQYHYIHLEYRDILACIDHPLIYSVRSSHVDHLAEDDPVIHLLIEVTTCLLGLRSGNILIRYIVRYYR